MNCYFFFNVWATPPQDTHPRVQDAPSPLVSSRHFSLSFAPSLVSHLKRQHPPRLFWLTPFVELLVGLFIVLDEALGFRACSLPLDNHTRLSTLGSTISHGVGKLNKRTFVPTTDCLHGTDD